MRASIEGPRLNTATACGAILRRLPDWFGIPEAIEHYESRIAELPTFLALLDDEVVGFMTVLKHNDYAAELYVLAVLAEHHRQGVGRALLAATEVWLLDEGVEYLQVKTLGPSRPNAEYEGTRVFFERMGSTARRTDRALGRGEPVFDHGEAVDAWLRVNHAVIRDNAWAANAA